MEPDPIRQTYDDYVRKVGLRDDPKYCSFVDFAAGAKWAARESAKLLEDNLSSLRKCEGWGIDERRRELGYALDKIRKHFGVEGEA